MARGASFDEWVDDMTIKRLSRYAAIGLLALGLAGCVYQPAPYYGGGYPYYGGGYYAPAYAYAPAPVYAVPSVTFGFFGGGHFHGHGH
jgi:hypothetical protein